MADLSQISLGKLVRGVSAVIAGWNGSTNEPEYADVQNGALAVVPTVDSDNPIPTIRHGRNELIYSGTASWGAGEAAGSAKVLNMPVPDLPTEDGKYLVSVVFQAPGVGLTVVLSNLVTVEGALTDIPVDRFSIAAGENWCIPVQFWLVGDGGRITLSNDAAPGMAFRVSALVHAA